MTDKKRLPRPRDPIELGKLIGDILTGQVEDSAPSPPIDPNKNQAAVELGRKGGLEGWPLAGRIANVRGAKKDRTETQLKSVGQNTK